MVTEDVTVVEGEVATISCRVKNSDDSVIQLLNPNRQTIYFRDFRREFPARCCLVENLNRLPKPPLKKFNIRHSKGFSQLFSDWVGIVIAALKWKVSPVLFKSRLVSLSVPRIDCSTLA